MKQTDKRKRNKKIKIHIPTENEIRRAIDSCTRRLKNFSSANRKIDHPGNARRNERTKIYALERLMPQKAIEKTTNRGIDVSGEYDIDFDLCCPICNAVVGTFASGENEYFAKYCGECGQAIKIDLGDIE